MTNTELLEKAYSLFAEGNVPAVLDLFHPQIEWRECTGFPFIKGDGISIGPAAVARDIFSPIPVHYEGFNVQINELFGSGDKVVMVGFYKGKWKATGKEFTANATHVWTVKENKITHFFQAVDTAEIIS